MARLQFWYELASNYSYLSAMRIEGLARAAGVEIDWRPFLLGPIFKAQGWTTSPFSIYPAKGRYMLRDMQRTADLRGLPFMMPASFPAASLMAARIATYGLSQGWGEAFSKAVFNAEFGRGEDISDLRVLADLLRDLGIDPPAAMAAAGDIAVKQQLKAATDLAIKLGIFGAPSFVTGDGELFWGDDRLEQALAWAVRSRSTGVAAVPAEST